MPRQPRFAIEPIEDLFQQLRYAPVETRLRQMAATELLVADIDPTQVYPQTFIEYRVTGYRSDTADEPVMLVGEAVVADLVTLVLRLSADAALAADHDGRIAMSLEEVARALGVSTRTIHRYRRQGLVCHMVLDAASHAQLVCFEDALQRFRERRRRAGGVAAPRLTAGQRETIVEAARSLQRTGVRTPHAAARRLSKRFGRTPEALRVLILAHDAKSASPVFPGGGPLDDRSRSLAWRAWRSTIPVSDIAARIGRTLPATHRVIAAERRRRTEALGLDWVELPTFDLDGADDVILRSPYVNTDIDVWPHAVPVRSVLAGGKGLPLSEDAEDALVAALNWLKRRACQELVSLGTQPTARALDCIETDLRWASALRIRIALAALPEALRTCELNLGRQLSTQPAAVIVDVVLKAIGVVCNVVDGLDPSRGQHLLRVAAQAMDRALIARPLAAPEHASGRAAARPDVDGIDLGGIDRILMAWHVALPGRDGLRDRMASLDPEARRLLGMRYGWGSGHPHTLDDMAAVLSRPRQSVGAAVFAAERSLAR
ncbi:MAG: MerR family transcriptional regulator [Planctomycetota bacterium]|jgi:hypothetical protein